MLCARDAAALDKSPRRVRAALASHPSRSSGEVRRRGFRPNIAPVVDRSIHEFGTLHILVNNAGVYGTFGTY